MPARPRRYVAAPTVNPLPFGLWSVVQPLEDTDPHWRNGIEFQPDLCEPANSTVGKCPEPDGVEPVEFTKVPVGRIGTVGTNPFTVYSWIDCGPAGGLWADANTRVAAALTQGEARAVERVFWTGRTDHPETVVYPHLASNSEVTDPGAADPNAYQTVIQPAADVPVEGPLDIVEAVGVLEQALAGCYPGVPTLHVPRGALAEMASHNLLVRQGPQLRTLSGSLVAAGAGYPGTGPGNTPVTYPTVWIYGTGTILGARSQIVTSSREAALDRATNRLVLIAERTYTLGWDCCLFAAEVFLGGRVAGSAGSPGPVFES